MNAETRIKMVKAMEFISRQINDEEIFCNIWLTNGIADGDIEYGDLSIKSDDTVSLDYYIQDHNFSDIIGIFLMCMSKAYRGNSGIFCDDVISKTREDYI